VYGNHGRCSIVAEVVVVAVEEVVIIVVEVEVVV
jgi:hypothetical protein